MSAPRRVVQNSPARLHLLDVQQSFSDFTTAATSSYRRVSVITCYMSRKGITGSYDFADDLVNPVAQYIPESASRDWLLYGCHEYAGTRLTGNEY